jgi:anti-sigma factor RsiW
MSVSRNHQHSDWEQQFERLSAYLDNEVGEAERAALERHLPTCEECQTALEELRQTRSLLRALPAPVSPRSFLIPETGAVPQPIGRRVAAGTSSLRHARRARVLQWAGGLVAAVGLFLLISSSFSAALPNATFGTARSSSAGHSSAAAPQQPSSTAVETQRPIVGGNTHVPTPATPGVREPTATPLKPEATTGAENSVSLGSIAGVLLLLAGAGLFLGGILFLRRP